MNKTWENGKKPNLRSSFGPKIFVVSFTSTSCLTMLQAMTACNFKEN